MRLHRLLRAHLLLAVGCVLPADDSGGSASSTACMQMPDSGECPAPEDVPPGSLTPSECGAEILSVDAERGSETCWFGPGGDSAMESGCWYDVTIRMPQGETCAYGRPFGAVAQATPRSDWCARRVHASGDAAEWTAIALAEHASIASFARFTLELLAHGAPSGLVLDAQRASADEVRHARLAFALASSFAGRPIGPGPLDVGACPPRTLAEVAASCVIEGCVAETVSALRLAQRMELERHPEVRRVLRTLARDEARHAALAWRTVRWALEVGGDDVRAAVEAALAGAPRDDAWAEVVAPVADALGLREAA